MASADSSKQLRTQRLQAQYARLDQAESRVGELVAEMQQRWIELGTLLRHIRDKRLYVDAGFKNWGAYAASGRLPKAITKNYANRLIVAQEVHEAIHQVVPTGTTEVTESTLRPLTKVRDPDSKQILFGQVKKLTRQAVKESENGDVSLAAAIKDAVRLWTLANCRSEDGRPDFRVQLERDIEQQTNYVHNLVGQLKTVRPEAWDTVSELQLEKFYKALRTLADLIET